MDRGTLDPLSRSTGTLAGIKRLTSARRFKEKIRVDRALSVAAKPRSWVSDYPVPRARTTSGMNFRSNTSDHSSTLTRRTSPWCAQLAFLSAFLARISNCQLVDSTSRPSFVGAVYSFRTPWRQAFQTWLRPRPIDQTKLTTLAFESQARISLSGFVGTTQDKNCQSLATSGRSFVPSMASNTHLGRHAFPSGYLLWQILEPSRDKLRGPLCRFGSQHAH